MRRTRLWLLLVVGLSGIFFISTAEAQSVKAYVDRNPVMADETVQLIVETDKASSGESPDWAPLEANFEVLGTSQSQHTSIINMRTTSLVRWTTTLAPKGTGTVTIPPIRVGNQQSEPIVLTVKKPSQVVGAAEGRDILIEAEVDSHVPYLQGQMFLTLRLLSAVSVQEGRLDEPEIEWGIVERVGKDTSSEMTRNGRRYQITERRYAISPQKSGTQIIPPVLFSGIIPDGRTRGTLFEELFGNRQWRLGRDPFQTTRQVHMRSPEIVLTVKEPPSDLNGRAWLPAKDLVLGETWSKDIQTLQMGDPLTRTVIIHAKGLRGEQLPEISLPGQDIVKVYPDKAKTQTDFDGAWVVGTREEKFALVPTQPGTVTVPAIQIPWWNIDTERWEEAHLPARTLTILGTQPISSPQRTPSPRMVRPEPPHDRDSRSEDSTILELGPMPPPMDKRPWPWIAGAFLVMWVLTLVAWWRSRQRQRGQARLESQSAEKDIQSERTAIQAVKAACLEQSAPKTRVALLKWASVKQKGQPCRNLGTVARMLAGPVPDNAEVSTAIWHLDRTLYTTSSEQQKWDGQRFWETVKPAMTAKPPPSQKNTQELPPLYLH